MPLDSNIPNFEGGLFSGDNGEGYQLYLGIPGISEKDRVSARDGEVEIRHFIHDGCLYMILGFDKRKDFLVEVVYDPCKEEEEFDLKEKKNQLSILILGENDDPKRVKMMRTVFIPTELFSKMIEIWEKALKTPNYSQHYEETLKPFYDYELEALWDKLKESKVIAKSDAEET